MEVKLLISDECLDYAAASISFKMPEMADKKKVMEAKDRCRNEEITLDLNDYEKDGKQFGYGIAVTAILKCLGYI